MYSAILKPFHLSANLTLKNKIIMAPMTRAKASCDFIPSSQMIEYYAKRAQAGLIITEGTIVSEKATGYTNVPGLFN